MRSTLASVLVWNRNRCYLSVPTSVSAKFACPGINIGVNDFESGRRENSMCEVLQLVLECIICDFAVPITFLLAK